MRIPGFVLELPQLKIKQFSLDLPKFCTKLKNNPFIEKMFLALFCLYFIQARIDLVLRKFGTEVINKKRPARSVFPDYPPVFYDYDSRQ